MRPMDALQLVADARDKYGAEFEHMYYNIAEETGMRGNRQGHLPRRDALDIGSDEALIDHSTVGVTVKSDYSDYALRVGDVYKRVGNSTLRTAEVFVVRPNMCQLIEHAVRDMPDQILLPSDPPSDAGIAFFDEGLQLPSTDTRDTSESPPIFAISWITTSVYVGSSPQMTSSSLDGDDGKPETHRTIFFTIFYDRDHHLTQKMTALGSGTTQSYVRRSTSRWPRMLMCDLRMWKYGELPNSKVPHPLFGYIAKRDPIAGRMQAFFALCRQELPSIERYEPTEKEMKWVRRLDMRTNPVSVILLRRKSGRGLEGTEVEWSHQWLVRGHWRNQWYATLKEHRLIYINPHIKGPEGKPLIRHEKVNILGR